MDFDYPFANLPSALVASSKRNRIEKVQPRVGDARRIPFPRKKRSGRPARKGTVTRIEEGCESIKPIHLRRPAFPKDPHDFLVALREGSD